MTLRGFNCLPLGLGGLALCAGAIRLAVPPKAELRLKPRALIDPDKVAAAAAGVPKGLIASSMVARAATARRIRTSLHTETAIIDVDFAVPPKVRMYFMPSKPLAPTEAERSMEDMDLACPQAFSDKWGIRIRAPVAARTLRTPEGVFGQF